MAQTNNPRWIGMDLGANEASMVTYDELNGQFDAKVTYGSKHIDANHAFGELACKAAKRHRIRERIHKRLPEWLRERVRVDVNYKDKRAFITLAGNDLKWDGPNVHVFIESFNTLDYGAIAGRILLLA
jgi:hypothetical protein